MDPGGDRIDDLWRPLSAVYATERTKAAIGEFVALDDPGAALGRALRFLAWQRTLLVVLGHLADAGVGLHTLWMPTDRVAEVFPKRRRVWTITGPERVSAGEVLALLHRHRQLLAEPVEYLMTAGVGGFVLLSGRAFQVAHPSYATRSEFDTDLLAPDLGTAAEIAQVLQDNGYPVEFARFLSLEPTPKAGFELGRQVGDHLVSIGVLVGGYHGHRGPIASRARPVGWRGGTVLVPSAEDMLVMLAARVVRKNQFAWGNFNDAAVILQEQPSLDWDLVVGAAHDAGAGSTLAVVLEGAEQVLGRSVVPTSTWVGLDRPPLAGVHRRLTRSVSDPTNRESATSRPTRPARRLRLLMWTVTTAARQVLAGARPGPIVAARRRVESAIYRRQRRRLETGSAITSLDRTVRWLRPRFGSLCEVSGEVAGGSRCIARLGGRPWNDEVSRQLNLVARSLPGQVHEHDCDRYVFALTSRPSAGRRRH